jgi:enhancer of polycomb-like protein
MPRNEQAKSSTLRNRQRITNKTRLKVIHGPIDADPVIIGEDDDRGINKSTAGVDADDAAVRYRSHRSPSVPSPTDALRGSF